MHPPPPPPLSARDGLSLQPNFQKGVGALTGTPFLEGVAGKEGGGDFFQGGCNFSTTNKLKSEILNDQKSL